MEDSRDDARRFYQFDTDEMCLFHPEDERRAMMLCINDAVRPCAERSSVHTPLCAPEHINNKELDFLWEAAEVAPGQERRNLLFDRSRPRRLQGTPLKPRMEYRSYEEVCSELEAFTEATLMQRNLSQLKWNQKENTVSGAFERALMDTIERKRHPNLLMTEHELKFLPVDNKAAHRVGVGVGEPTDMDDVVLC